MKTKPHCDMSLQGKLLPVHWQLFQLAFWWREEITIFHSSSLVLINHFQVLASSRNNTSLPFKIISTIPQQSSLCLVLFSNYLHYLDDIIFHVHAVRPLLYSWFIIFQSLCLLNCLTDFCLINLKETHKDREYRFSFPKRNISGFGWMNILFQLSISWGSLKEKVFIWHLRRLW